jgi:DNA excision repair protein ERCC-2
VLSVSLEKRQILASVRDLVAWPPDPPRPTGWLPRARAELGAGVHARHRTERERLVPGYAAEVPVALTCDMDGFTVRLTGRADGVVTVRDEASGQENIVVEEVKSVGIGTPRTAGFRLQLRLYALCLARARPGVTVRCRLVLTSVIDGSRRELEVAFDPDRTERRLVARVRAVIRAARRSAERARVRAEAARGLTFPFPRPRPGQNELMAVITDGLEAGRPVLATAPTGIGKTVSALLSALRFALTRNAVVFFATAKTTQQDLVARTFRDLASTPGRGTDGLRSLTLRAKARMCPTGEFLCHPDHCAHLRNFLDPDRREPLLRGLVEGSVHLDPEAIHRAGEAGTVCPYAISLALTREVDCVIGDYNYVYGPSAALDLVDAESTARDLVVVLDEAHNLFDRARDYYSPYLGLAQVKRLAAEGPFAPARAFLDELVAFIERSREEAEEACPASLEGCRSLPVHTDAWRRLGAEAIRLTVRYAAYREEHLSGNGPVPRDDPLVEVLETVVRMRDLLLLEAPELVGFACSRESATRGVGVGILCVDPARKLAERHRRMLGTVALSATLAPLEHYRDVLGFDGLDPVLAAFPSPFPAAHRRVVVVPTVSTTFRERDAHAGEIARLITRCVAVKPGHYVAYFPSFRFLETVRARLAVGSGSVMVQRPGMDPEARSTIMRRLRTDPRPLLLLAVMGGVFAEGVDVPGDGLVGAIVVGPGLPQVGFERTLMQRYFDAKTERGFAHAMLVPGLQRVVQSAGRVHRTPDDRGVIVLLDRRFARRPYVDCLPRHWYDDSPDELIADDPVKALEAFWNESIA